MFGGGTGTTDVQVGQPPSDAISSLSWSPTADFLAVGSWDNNVRVYQIDPSSGQTRPVTSYPHDLPVLGVCWNKEGNKIFSGSADKSIKIFDVATGQATKLGEHQGPVKEVKWANAQSGVLASTSWDKTLKYWDLRSPDPVASIDLQERAYSMDTAGDLLLVGTAERRLCLVNLTAPTQLFKVVYSALKFQTRAVACMPQGRGYVVSSIEGRVSVNFFSENPPPYTFRCHRKDVPGNQSKYQKTSWFVNSVAFHQDGALSTAGSDGGILFWDIARRSKLKALPEKEGPVVATAFNHTGQWFAYAVSYDWSKGFMPELTTTPNKIFIHKVALDDIKRT